MGYIYIAEIKNLHEEIEITLKSTSDVKWVKVLRLTANELNEMEN